MTGFVVYDDSFPHGTVAGYTGGCRGGACPAVLSCRSVNTRYAGDWGFRRRVDAGDPVEKIVADEAAAAKAARRRVFVKSTRSAPTRIDWIPRMRELHADGLTDREIGVVIGVTKSRVGEVRRAVGLPPVTTTRPVKPVKARRVLAVDEHRDEVRRMHAEGCSDVVIASTLGVSRSTVQRTRLALGLAVKSAPVSRRDEIARLHGEGFTDREIGERVGVSRLEVGRVRRLLGLSLNPAARGYPARRGVAE